jgi:HAD superfamily hydrolase (TIGR01509 family)
MVGRELCRYDAVVFDCDGVLIDSEPIAARVISQVLAEHNIRLSPEECLARFVSMSVEQEAEYVRKHFGIGLLDVFHRELTPRTMKAFERELRPMPGVMDALEALMLPKAVASNGAPERMELALRVTGLAQFFLPHVYSAAHVARGKPAPDVFLHAAERLGVPARRCLAIEDSVAGVQAARAAGMEIIGFVGGSHAGVTIGSALREAGAVRVFEAWKEVCAALWRPV